MENIIATIEASCLEIYRVLGETIPTSSSKQSSDLIEKENSSGDIQKPLDITTDHIISTNLAKLSTVAGILSEEQDAYKVVNPSGNYIISFDPLDGSGNSPLNLSTGSIFAIFRASRLEDISGKNIVAAIYSIYGPTLEIIKVSHFDNTRTRTVYPNKNGVLTPIMVDDYLTIPNKGKIYVANEGNYGRWSPKIQKYVNALRGRSLRWMACFVADIHRLLIEGGTYLYTSDQKQPEGKLRLVYEVYPMAYIWEQCGGISRDETGRSCLDIPFNPAKIHQRSPILLFGKYEYQLWNNLL